MNGWMLKVLKIHCRGRNWKQEGYWGKMLVHIEKRRVSEGVAVWKSQKWGLGKVDSSLTLSHVSSTPSRLSCHLRQMWSGEDTRDEVKGARRF